MFSRTLKRDGFRTLALAGAFGLLAGGQATAADIYGANPGATAPMAPAPMWQLELSANVALATEYVFRGISQTDENPAIQGGFDASYGLFYAGAWASNLDFGGADTNGDGIADSDVANIEIDWYGGIKKEFHGVELDLGVIYYTYPNAFDPGAELDYWELKGGVSATLLHDISASFTTYYAWEYTGEIGENWVFEGALEMPLPEVLGLSPTVSGTLAYNDGDVAAGGVNYWYWNAGLGLGFYERFNLDLRYWDTANLAGCGTATLFQCDDRYVATLSAEF